MLELSTYGIESAGGVVATGTTWKDLLDKTIISADTEIWSLKTAKSGSWAGTLLIRVITPGNAKIFPFNVEAIDGVHFTDGAEWSFPAPITVPVSSGYKMQFRSSSTADIAGSCALSELAKIEYTNTLASIIGGALGTALITVGVNQDKTGYSGTAALVTGNIAGNVIGTVGVTTSISQIEGVDATDQLATAIRAVMGTALITIGVNQDKTGYSGTAALVTGNVNGNVIGTVGALTTNADKTGYSLTMTQPNLTIGTVTTAVNLTTNLDKSGYQGTAVSISDKAGYSLAIGQSAVTIGTVNTVVSLTANADKTGYSVTTNLDKSGYQGTAVSVLDKTGYSVTTNLDKAGYQGTAVSVLDKTGYTVSTVSDKAGYSLASDQSSVTIGNVTTIIGNVNGNIVGTVNTATNLTTNNDKTGYTVTTVTGNVNGNVIGTVNTTTNLTTNNDKTGYTVSTVSDKTGYSLAIDQSAVTIGVVNTAGSVTNVNWIADALLKRDIDQVEVAAPTHSLTVAILKAVSRIRDDGGTLQTFCTDGTTIKMSQTITTDANNQPIDELTAGT